MSDASTQIETEGEMSARLLEAVSCLEQALSIAEAAGLSSAAARIDHALVTMRGEIADRK